MATQKKLRLLIDQAGSLEILGFWRGVLQARKIAEDLGIQDFYPLDPLNSAIRADGLTPEVLEEIAQRAEPMGIEVKRVEKLAPSKKPVGGPPPEEEGSTMQALHQHSLDVSRKEKILVPITLLIIGAILVAAGTVIRDHFHHAYKPVRSVGDVVRLSQDPSWDAGGVQAIINPSDDGYVAVEIRGWQYWGKRSAVTHDHYIRTPELQARTIEDLVKAERSAAALVLRIDLTRSEGNRFQVDEILRGGLRIEEPSQVIEIYPLTLAERPVIGGDNYRNGAGISYDKTSSFRGVTRLASVGGFQIQDGKVRFVSDEFNVALSEDMDPGLVNLLEDIAREQPQARLTVFMTLEETYPWTENGKPGRRQTEKEIGLARVDGLQLAKIFVGNGAPEGKKTAA
jgi:hypothetical protein